MKGFMLLLVAVASFSSCMAQIPGFGACPNVTVMQNFDTSRYVGQWYEAERYYTTFEFEGKCNSALYSANSDGTGINIVNKEVNSWTGTKSNITGYATVDPQEPSKLTLVLSGVSFHAPYWVLDTDYENYSVVWSCYEYGIFNAKFSWILTRDRKPASNILSSAYDVINRNGISETFYTKTNQDNCPEGY